MVQESQDGGIHFLGFSHSTLGTERLARRKPALHRQTEYSHNRAIPRIHTYQKRFPKRVVFLLLSSSASNSSAAQLLTPRLFDDPNFAARTNFKIVVTVVIVDFSFATRTLTYLRAFIQNAYNAVTPL